MIYMEKVQPIRDRKALDAMKRILRRKSYRDYIMFLLGCNTALRVGDLLRLTAGDVASEYITVREEKTGKARRSKLPEGVRREIEAYTVGMAADAPLFPSREGGRPISTVQAWRILSSAAKEAGLAEIGTHSMRKSFAYHAYKKTKDVALVQHVLNHSSPSVTRRYLGIEDDEIEKALEGFEL
jgi:integrase